MGTSITAPTDPLPVHSHPPLVSKITFFIPIPNDMSLQGRLISYTHLWLSHPIYISSDYLCHDLSCHKHNSSTTFSLRGHTIELQEIANLMRTQCFAGWTPLQKCLLRLNSPCLPPNHHTNVRTAQLLYWPENSKRLAFCTLPAWKPLSSYFPIDISNFN